MEKSPLKWMGSKKKLIPFISQYIPKSYNKYIEPFFGSGIVFFSQEPEIALCSDLQSEPIIIINAIKNKPKQFCNLFNEYSNRLWEDGADYYYHIRDLYNKNEYTDELNKAAVFMLLVKAGFNGLIRFNSKGHWNVPFGDRGNKTSKEQARRLLLDQDEVFKYSEFLNSGNKIFIQQSFEESIGQASKGDFIYCDPPYLITTQQYNLWNNDLELRLFNSLKEASNRGAKFILSNVYKYKNELNKDLLGLYKDFKYKLFSHSYIIGPNQKRRQSVDEVVIFN